MKKLIVNADDFGLTEGVNRAIVDGHRNGIITSATLMANGMAFDSAVLASLGAPGLGVGVHLNLTQGRPVSPSCRVPSIVGSEGSFYLSPGILARRILMRKVEPREVEIELRGQIEKIAAAGIRITHLDSHKHIHLLPPIFGVVVRLAREFGIDCVRCPIEPASSAMGPLQSGGKEWPRMARQYLLGRGLSTLAACQVRKLEQVGVRWPEHFYGLSQTGFLDDAILEQILRNLPDGVSELMCHPGYLDAALLETRTRLKAEREAELRALTNLGIRQLVAREGIELISYEKLPSAEAPGRSKYNEPVQEAIRKG